MCASELTLVAENFRLLCEMKKFTMDVEGKKLPCFCAISTKEEGEMLTNDFQIENMA